VTTPTAAATPGGGNGGGEGSGNGGGDNNAGGNNGNGSQPTQVAVAGRQVASPAGDGRSTLEVAPASGTRSDASHEVTTGWPHDTSTLTSDAPDTSGSSTASTSSAPDLADPSRDDAIDSTWRVAAFAALFVLGLAVALLIAAARPRGGAHRRH